MLIQRDVGQLELYNVETDQRERYEAEPVGKVGPATNHPSRDWIVLINQPDRMKPRYEVLVIRPGDQMTGTFAIPSGKVPSKLIWLDESSIQVDAREWNSMEEETILIDWKR